MVDGVGVEVMGEQGSHSSFSAFPSVPCSPSLCPLPHRSLIFQHFFSPSPFRSPLSFSPSPQVASSLFPLPGAPCPVPCALCPQLSALCPVWNGGEGNEKGEKGGEGKRELDKWDMRDGIFEGMGEKAAQTREKREARGERRDVKGCEGSGEKGDGRGERA